MSGFTRGSDGHGCATDGLSHQTEIAVIRRGTRSLHARRQPLRPHSLQEPSLSTVASRSVGDDCDPCRDESGFARNVPGVGVGVCGGWELDPRCRAVSRRGVARHRFVAAADRRGTVNPHTLFRPQASRLDPIEKETCGRTLWLGRETGHCGGGRIAQQLVGNRVVDECRSGRRCIVSSSPILTMPNTLLNPSFTENGPACAAFSHGVRPADFRAQKRRPTAFK